MQSMVQSKWENVALSCARFLLKGCSDKGRHGVGGSGFGFQLPLGEKKQSKRIMEL
jgi:hypothetical protein